MTVAVVPVGVLTAVYLHEYAPPRSPRRALVRIAVTNLAGVPSIVFGLFGLGLLHPVRRRRARPRASRRASSTTGQPALLWAALTLAVLTLPVGDRRDRGGAARRPARAPRREPRAGRHASPRRSRAWCSRRRCPGILTGAILAVSRGAGEVAPILFTGAAYFLPELPSGSVWTQFMHLGYHTYVLATQSPDVEATRPLLYATVFVLLRSRSL